MVELVPLIIVTTIAALVLYHVITTLVKVLHLPNKCNWPFLKGTPILGCLEYYKDRYEFQTTNHSRFGNFFEFRLLNLRIFSVSSAQDVNTFLSTSENILSFDSGIVLLMGGNIPDVDKIPNPAFSVAKVIHQALNKSYFESKFSTLIQDVVRCLDKFQMSRNNKDGIKDPFNTFFGIAFQLSAGMMTSDHLSAPETVTTLQQLVMTMDQNLVGYMNLFPFIITPRKARFYMSIFRLGSMMNTEVSNREKEKDKKDKKMNEKSKVINHDDGDSKNDKKDIDITMYKVAAEYNDYIKKVLEVDVSNVGRTTLLVISLWVSVVNTGTILAWTMIFIHYHRDWRNRILTVLQKLVDKTLYDCLEKQQSESSLDNNNDVDSDSPKISTLNNKNINISNSNKAKKTDRNLYEDLQKLSYDAFDCSECDVLDWIINETARMVIVGNLTRRVLKPGVVLKGHEIPVRSFVVASIFMLHYDPAVYTNPYEFHSERWSDGNLLKNHKNSFVGFGQGRHPCVGQKLARLEIKLAIALAISKYNFDVIIENDYNHNKGMSPMNSINIHHHNKNNTTSINGNHTTTTNSSHKVYSSTTNRDDSILAPDYTCLTSVFPRHKGLRLQYSLVKEETKEKKKEDYEQ